MRKILFIILFLIIIFINGKQVSFLTEKISFNMVCVEPGSFNMGSTTGDDDEKPIHKVIITKPFYISKYEMTNEQAVILLNWAYSNHKIFIGLVSPGNSSRWIKTKNSDEPVNYNRKYGIIKMDNPGVKIDFKDNKFYVKKGCEKYPLFGINWVGAVTLCNFLSEMEGFDPVYNISDFGPNFKYDSTKNGYRIPTESEWEYACRGGNKSKNFIYSGSNDPDEVAWYRDNSNGALHPVGQKKPNELGIYDMSGNAAEICFDVYNSKYYSKSETKDPLGPDNFTLVNLEDDLDPDNGLYHLRRGGFFGSFKNKIRSTDRIWGVYYCPELCTLRLVRNIK